MAASEISMEGDLATQLHAWSMKKMHFRPQGRHVTARMPTPDDFRAICRGQMVKVWEYVLENIHSAQSVKTVRGNLTLKNHHLSSSYRVKYKSDKKYSHDKEELLEKKKRINSELQVTLSDIGHLERELDRLEKEILSVDKQYTESFDHIGDTRCQVALLTAHNWQLTEGKDQYVEFMRKLQSISESHLTRARKGFDEDQYFSRKDGRMIEKGLETACMREVRETCASTEVFLGQLLKGEFNTDKALMQKSKEHLWKLVELLMQEHPANHVVHALTLLSQESAMLLKERTSNIDIHKDAQSLRFKYENGQLLDTATQPSVLQSVHQLLMESQGSHLHRFLETEKCQNKTAKLQVQLCASTEKVKETLWQTMKADAGALELAKKLYETEAETVANHAALKCLEDIAENLRDNIAISAREKETLFTKYQKIQDFRKLTESKQNLIRVLAKQNTNAKDRLEKLQAQIYQYMSGALVGHEAKIRTLTQDLSNGVSQEVETFTKLQLPYLMFTLLENGQRLAVIDLSINCLSHRWGKQAEVIQRILKSMAFPAYKAPEYLLAKVAELIQEVTYLESHLKSHSFHIQSLEGHGASHRSLVEHIAGLCQQVRDQDQKQLDQLLPALNKSIGQATKALTDCLHLRDTAQAWWEQPSQYETPWLMVDGLTYQQWKDKWTIVVTQLRQQLWN